MVNTHCKPSGSLAANEISVNNICDASVSTVNASGGLKRGVVVWIPGMAAGVPAIPGSNADVGGILPVKIGTFSAAVAADGWQFINVPAPDYLSPLGQVTALYNDVANDSGHGSRYLATTLHWWDHVVAYIQAKYGNLPIVPFGMSWGGWRVLQIANNRASTIVAAGAHEFCTFLSHVSATFTPPKDFSGITTTGCDTASSVLNAFTGYAWLSWHSDSTAIQPADCAAVNTAASNAGVQLTHPSVGTGDHCFNSTDETNAMSWFTGTLDSHFPRAF